MSHIRISQIPTIFDYFVTNYHQLLPTYIKMKLSLTPLYTISSTLTNMYPTITSRYPHYLSLLPPSLSVTNTKPAKIDPDATEVAMTDFVLGKGPLSVCFNANDFQVTTTRLSLHPAFYTLHYHYK